MKLVVIESPYAGTPEQIEENLKYLRAAMKDCLLRGEAPYASHALYTQPGVLDDTIPEERSLGIEAGFCWGERAELVVFYADRGWSRGMLAALNRAHEQGRKVQIRRIYSSVENEANLIWVCGADDSNGSLNEEDLEEPPRHCWFCGEETRVADAGQYHSDNYDSTPSAPRYDKTPWYPGQPILMHVVNKAPSPTSETHGSEKEDDTKPLK